MQRLILSCVVFSTLALADSETIWRVFSFQANSEGKFTVICSNGSTEVVSQVELLEGRACGDPPPVFVDEGMTAGIRVNTNTFKVKCSDGSTEMANLRTFRESAPCFRVGRQLLGGDTFTERSQNIAQDVLQLQPFEIGAKAELHGFGIQTVNSPDPQMVLGIYSADKEGFPAKLVVQSKEMDVAGSQLYVTSAEKTNLKPGKYFVAAHTNGTVSAGGPTSKKSIVSGFQALLPYTGTLPASLPGKALQKIKHRPYAFFAIARTNG